jgi:hypothetical protein
LKNAFEKSCLFRRILPKRLFKYNEKTNRSKRRIIEIPNELLSRLIIPEASCKNKSKMRKTIGGKAKIFFIDAIRP